MELFNSAEFSSKNDDALRDFEIDVSSKKKAIKRCGVPLSLGTQSKLDPAWDDGSAFPSCEVGRTETVTHTRSAESSSKNFLEEKQKDFVVGDTCGTRVRERCGTTDNDACGNGSDDRIQPEAETTPKSKASDCWYTPPEIVDLVQKSLSGITLDPCADDRKHIEACHHLTAAEDGLSQQWFGRVFMNPPYSCPSVWIAKLQEEFNCGRVEEAMPAAGFAYALVPVATDTKWFHPLISSNLICFWKGRIKFLDVNYQPKMAARQSHCLIYWGKNQSRFRQVFSSFGTFNYKQEKEATECLHNLTSAQGLAQDSPLPQQFLEDSSFLESQKSMITAQASCQNGSPVSATTVTCEVSQCEISENSGEKSTLLQLRHHVSPFQSKDRDLEQMTKGTASPQSLELSTPTDPDLQLSKTSQDCSPVPTLLEIEECTLTTLEVNSIYQDTLSKGLSFQVVTSQPPLIEEDCYWLPSPTALSTKFSRPPGQTKLENFLKENAIINKRQVINPDFLESAYDLPIGWTDPQDNRSVWEFLEETQQSAIAALPLETPLTGELPPLDFAASPTSTPCVETCTLQLKAITLHQPWACLVGRSKYFETRSWSTNYRGKIAIHAAKKQHGTDEWCSLLKDLLPPVAELVFGAVVAEDKKQSSSIESLSLSPVESNTTPEKFLEESTADTKQLPSQKRRQRKGCLYKYLENKKLKNGNIASYPRVIGETRDPDNPKHWRWGFNWEEKIDGEWKGRSIGSVPIGAIALIQSMQKSGVPLSEIIGFIRRSKNKG